MSLRGDRSESVLTQAEIAALPLVKYISYMRGRSATEIAAKRESTLQAERPRPLPEGKTLEEVIGGKWPGDETEEEIKAVLSVL